MRRLGLALALLVAASGPAWAQLSISLNRAVVPQGGTVQVTVNGTPGRYYAVIGSQTNSGFSFGGLDLAVGPDVTVHDTGIIPAGGSVTVDVPARLAQRDRYYLQAVTSLLPTYSPLAAQSNSEVVVNLQAGQLFMPAAGRVNANGTATAISPGLTVNRTAPGVYTVSYNGVSWNGVSFNGLLLVPDVTPLGPGAEVLDLTVVNTLVTVTLNTDAPVWFSLHPVIR